MAVNSSSPDVIDISTPGTIITCTKEPWEVDGETWHLNRCSTTTKEILKKLDDILRSKFQVDGPKWNQKYYVAYKIEDHNWLAINTHPSTLLLHIHVKPGTFRSDYVAKQLGIAQFGQAESLSEKLGLPTSVSVVNRNKNTDIVTIRLKEDFDLNSSAFLNFLEECKKAFSKME